MCGNMVPTSPKLCTNFFMRDHASSSSQEFVAEAMRSIGLIQRSHHRDLQRISSEFPADRWESAFETKIIYRT